MILIILLSKTCSSTYRRASSLLSAYSEGFEKSVTYYACPLKKGGALNIQRVFTLATSMMESDCKVTVYF